MALILGIETSCDETAAAVYDSTKKQILSNAIFSQISLHAQYGGVVPEIASRSHLEKISLIVRQALDDAHCKLDDLETIAVTMEPGLVGSLLIGLCFAKGLAWASNKHLIGVNHLHAHILSAFLDKDGKVRTDLEFPHICFAVSGGHTALYLVKDFDNYEKLGQTLDDAAGEAFDKVSKLIGLGYPGGPIIEKLAREAGFEDCFGYPRTRNKSKSFDFSFSGLKTAVLYDLVKRGAFDLHTGIVKDVLTPVMQQQVASSLLVCIADIFKSKLKLCFKEFPDVQGVTFVGGVACNKYLREEMANYCQQRGKYFIAPPASYCGDNAAMIAFTSSIKNAKCLYDSLTLDVGSK